MGRLQSRVSLVVLLTVGASARAGQAVENRPPLAPGVFVQLPLTSVKPRGWLRDQLLIQAEGLSGHLDEFWSDLGPNSAWLGGSGEGWERGPYYADGLVPLAYLLGDAKLIAKAKKWVDWTLEHQRPDGAIGPEKNADWWPNMLMLKALTQYQEASGDPRVVPLMERYFAYQAKQLDQRPLKEWAIFRWHDEVLSVLWLYNRTGDESLLRLARKLHDKGHDWEAQFAAFPYTSRIEKAQATLSTHGVNNAMALKAAAVWYLITNRDGDREAAYRMLRELDAYHSLPNGIFSADEHYAGRNPSQGTELCAVVEAMFSLETDIAILGDASFGDRLEKLAFNPLPGTFTRDMWAHQYDQQPNQIMCSLADRNWATNGPDSNLFGLEPNFGCCTANMHQGWPKFAANLWMAAPGGGLAAAAYAPSEVRTTIHDVPVTVVEETDYPFRDRIRLAVDPAKPAQFPLVLRIPAWAESARVTVNGTVVSGVQPGRFVTVDRTWNPGDRAELTFPMGVRISKWYHNSIAVERGPLVYSLAIGETWHKLKQTGPAADWEIFPSTPWNYALSVDLANPPASFTVEEHAAGKQPFSVETAPVVLRAIGRRLPAWEIEDSSAGTLPESPVSSKQPEETLRLVPYGAAKLRITAFPFLAVAPAAQARWSSAKAAEWYAKQPWLVGSNYIPATAINELEMWQAETFDPKQIDKELGWAEGLGMNTMRVFLHDLLWQQDRDGFKSRINTFLGIAAKHKIRPLFVLFDSCWDPAPKLGKQHAPVPGIHNSGWVQSPGAKALSDPAEYPRLEAYVKGVVGAFAADDRILAWDIWNEPDNRNDSSYGGREPANKVDLVAKLLPQAFAWVRAANPRQPLTSGVWQGDWSSPAKWSPITRTQFEESDVISFHNYDPPAEFTRRVESLEPLGRPLICTEYMARGNGSTFQGSLPVGKKYKVAMINWGFVAGKTQTNLPWDSWQKPYTDRAPAIWFHEIFYPDGKPYRPEEVEFIRQMTGKAAVPAKP